MALLSRRQVYQNQRRHILRYRLRNFAGYHSAVTESPYPTMSAEPKADAAPQSLLIDLDDTLCENNIYFERAIAQFISFLNHRELSLGTSARGHQPFRARIYPHATDTACTVSRIRW